MDIYLQDDYKNGIPENGGVTRKNVKKLLEFWKPVPSSHNMYKSWINETSGDLGNDESFLPPSNVNISVAPPPNTRLKKKTKTTRISR